MHTIIDGMVTLALKNGVDAVHRIEYALLRVTHHKRLKWKQKIRNEITVVRDRIDVRKYRTD